MNNEVNNTCTCGNACTCSNCTCACSYKQGREMIRDIFVACCHFQMNKDEKLTGEHKNPEECSLCKGY
jgi:hypothetical protein